MATEVKTDEVKSTEEKKTPPKRVRYGVGLQPRVAGADEEEIAAHIRKAKRDTTEDKK